MDEEQLFEGQRSIGLVEADIEDNCIEHGVRGILKHDDIVRMLAEYDPDDMQARAWGKFQHLTGLIYKKFHPTVHVINPIEIKWDDWVVVEAFDAHPRTKDAIQWVAFDAYGRKVIVDEIWDSFDGYDELAWRIKKKADQFRVVTRLLDPSAWIVDQHTQTSLYSELYKRGLLYEQGSKARAMAISVTKSALDYQYKNGVYIKVPELYVFNTCKRSIWEFQHWKWSEWSGKSAESRGPNEKPEDKDDHMMENIGRVLMSGVKYTPYIKPSQRKALDMVRRNQVANDDPYD